MRAYPWCFALLSLVLGCGAGTSSGAAPRSTTDDAETPRGAETRRADGAEEPGGAAEESKPVGPSCEDGSCSRCGSGICPTGWYCDEKASGGGACSWLAECASKATCGCVTRVLGAACRCREEGGGVKVACD